MRITRSVWFLFLVLILFLWAGMVSGISFLEAPLKFTAPQITVALGLGIGRIVFHALNKVELAFLLVALVSARALRVPASIWFGLGLISFVLALQTLWLLPALDVRAVRMLAGQPVMPSHLHTFYIGLEIVKLLALLLTGGRAFLSAVAVTAHEPSEAHQVA